MSSKPLTDAMLGEALRYLKQPKYGASFLIMERPHGLEGLKVFLKVFWATETDQME